MSRLASAVTFCLSALLAGEMLAAQNPCICATSVRFDPVLGWILAPCGLTPCGPGLGVCATEDFQFAEPGLPLSTYVRCNCTLGNPLCACRGLVRNPDFNPQQAPTLVFCEQLSACSPTTATCKPDHLLSLPNLTVPVCQCQ